MKKILFLFGIVILMSFFFTCPVFAKSGKGIGFWGGITEGTRLPKTTEVILAQTAANKNSQMVMPYKELVFLSGSPVEYEGTIAIKTTGAAAADAGTFKVSYVIAARSGDNASISRNITFNVNYRKEGSQTIYDYESTAWTENISSGGKTYRLVPSLSHFGVSILEDNTPGVSYFRGDLSQKTVYNDGTENVTLESSGSLYGYDCAWSNTETARIDSVISTGEWQMQYQTRPSVSVNKVLQYSENEPSVISFSGNYKEVMSNLSGLQYNIFVQPRQFYGIAASGGISISTHNTFEQLTAPDLAFLKGHPAEQDVRRLFSMQILEGDAKRYIPAQAATRGQFVSMLVKAIKLPIERIPAGTAKKPAPMNIVFPDVMPGRPDYPYIMVSYKAGIASGRGKGLFQADAPIQREEAIVMMIKALGLSNLGQDPTALTPFADNASISDWARREISSAYRVGLIPPDNEGRLLPKANLTKAEAVAFINLLIDYMRTGIQLDYTEHIVNYPR